MDMTEEQQQAVLNMCQATVAKNLRDYQAIRMWFRAVGFDPTDLDEVADGSDKSSPSPAREPDNNGHGGGFRTEPPWA